MIDSRRCRAVSIQILVVGQCNEGQHLPLHVGVGAAAIHQYLPPGQVDRVTEKSVSEGLTALLTTMCSELHLLVADLLYLIRHNARVQRARALGGRIYAHTFSTPPVPRPQNFVYQCQGRGGRHQNYQHV